MGSNDLVLEIQQLQTYFYVRGQVAKAVDEVDLAIASGQTLGLVGESGCGKSVTAHSIIGLIPDPPGKVVGGKILFEGTNLLELPEARMRKIRGNRISMVFQEPMTSLNPVYSVAIRWQRSSSSTNTCPEVKPETGLSRCSSWSASRRQRNAALAIPTR